MLPPSNTNYGHYENNDEAKKEMMKIPYSDDTIKNRIIHLSDDTEKTVTNKLITNKLYFALQIDESTDISGIAHILGFVCFIDENKIMNQFLCCKQPSIKTNKRGRLTSIEEEMRVAILSYILPDIENIYKSHQVQISHTQYSISIFFFLTFFIILLLFSD